MIYDAMDKLQASPKVVELATKIAELDEAIMQRMDRDRKEIARLLRALQAKDEKIEKLTNYGNVYRGEMDKYFHALRLAVEDMETLKPKGKMCVMSVLDEETAVHCSGRNDCDDCLFWFYTKRAMSHIEMIKSAVHDEIEGRKRMDERDTSKAMKEGLNA